jgi:hypothetical protein
MLRKFTALSCAAAVACAFSVASASAYSVPLASVKAGGSVMLVKKDGGGHGGKNWSNGGNKNWSKGGNKNWSKGGNKNWSNKGGDKNWNHKGGDQHWSGKGYNKRWSKYDRWHGGDHYRGGYWRNGIFFALPFVIGDQCYDYLDWRDGVPRPGWYWVC